jgi:hypothetical protein
MLTSTENCPPRGSVRDRRQQWKNVKYEDIYLKSYNNLADLTVGLIAYFEFYNQG